MQIAALLLACLGCTVYSQEIRRTEKVHKTSPADSLASLLFATNPVANFHRMESARAGINPGMDVELSENVSEVVSEVKDVRPGIEEWAGVTAPLGFFDPFGFSKDVSEGRQRFYREVELKHGRLSMLAAVGILVAENFHPLFGGQIDVPAILAFQTTLQIGVRSEPSFVYAVILFAIFIPEVFSVFTFNSPFGGEPWSIREDHEPGNLGFDPLGLKPTDKAELKELQTKELNNGRLAMLGAAGMLAQELVSGDTIVGNIQDPLKL
jgi:hypothetical protein